ncbi:hypothetical protein N7478_012362 [Penicillium angulare]|uniref:uncharacterized protein n=1 Tax=Penicillium angulare TaxID=116970 RepID=UPI00253F969E|nr:uncharacterized protein N7478_012362 [Penicillium angulare]KAJ5259381.1 hypothetical protein N7478_012362 [Penicillium angulare]
MTRKQIGSVRAFNIDAIQGNEADIVIFDYVRTGKQHGFMGAFRRLNVACSRGRFGFYLVYYHHQYHRRSADAAIALRCHRGMVTLKDGWFQFLEDKLKPDRSACLNELDHASFGWQQVRLGSERISSMWCVS